MCSNERVVAIHQPNYIPWIGYFHKILKSDVFVILDHVEYTRRGFINRNKVKGPKGVKWLTVPVKLRDKERIMDVKIDNAQLWRRKHVFTIKSFYGKAPYFDEVFSNIEDVYNRDWEYLVDLNMELIFRISEMLGIDTEFVRSSNMQISSKKEDMIIEICKKLKAKVYFSGRGAMAYQDPLKFEKNGIKLVYQDFKYPQYKQRFGEFIPNLSVLDVLFNMGIEKTREILRS